MLIKSFIVHISLNRKNEVLRELKSLENCQVIPAENKSILVVAIESEDVESESKFILEIESIFGIQHLTLVFGASA